MRSIQFPFRSFLYNFNRQLKISPDKQQRQHSSQTANWHSLLKVISCTRFGKGGGAKPPKPSRSLTPASPGIKISFY